MKHTEVIIVGAGPTGLLLAAELRLAGVRPLVLERQPGRRTPRRPAVSAGRSWSCCATEGCSTASRQPAPARPRLPASRFPFGGVHRDFTRLTDPPLHALPLPQQQLEKLLDEHACELGADIRRGHQVIGLSQDDAAVTVSELQNSVHRVLGVRLPVREATRLSRFTFKARQADSYRQGRILLAGDAAHLFPAAGVALNAGLLDAVNLAWKLAADLHGGAPAGLLDTYHGERHLAGARTMLHTRAQVALRRGHDEAAEALRQLFQELLADEEPLRRMGALVAGAGIRRAAD